LEFNVPFQHKYGYIRDDLTTVNSMDRKQDSTLLETVNF